MKDLKNLAEIFIMLGNELNKIADEKDKQEEEKEVLLSKQDVLDKYKCFNWISEKSVDSHKSFIGF